MKKFVSVFCGTVAVLFGFFCLHISAADVQNASPAAVVADQKTPAKTLENLIKAHNGESNAAAKYEAFATKADEEGFKGVASLFRAASKAEAIHVANHAKVIEQLGGKPAPVIEKIDVKSTKENLEAALKGETYEKDVMYPEMIKQAETDDSDDALQTLTYAMKAEVEHAKLYTDAIANLDKMKDAKKDFFVCKTCGFTTTDLAMKNCPVCATAFADEMKVN